MSSLKSRHTSAAINFPPLISHICWERNLDTGEEIAVSPLDIPPFLERWYTANLYLKPIMRLINTTTLTTSETIIPRYDLLTSQNKSRPHVIKEFDKNRKQQVHPTWLPWIRSHKRNLISPSERSSYRKPHDCFRHYFSTEKDSII